MAHKHPVTDTDVRLILDPYTKLLKDTMPEAKTIMRGDHGAEIITVEMPRTIEGHDMMLCDKRQVWFENGKNKSFDDIKDLQVSIEDDTTLIFSWKIPRRATQNVGTLSFMFYFACSGEDDPEYEYHTHPFTKLTVKDHPVSKSDVDMLQELIDDYIATITFKSINTVSTKFTKSDNIVVETSELDDGTTASSSISFDDSGIPVRVASSLDSMVIEVNFDDDGHPSSLLINDGVHPIAWENFEQFSKLDGSNMMLYNEVPLPNIESVWTDEKKKKHPFAVIRDNANEVELMGKGSLYDLYLFGERPRKHSEEQAKNLWSGVIIFDETDSGEYTITYRHNYEKYTLSLDGTCWDYIVTYDIVRPVPCTIDPPFLWWSHDIFMADGSEYLEASPEPTPVTADLTEQQSFMIGYGLGVSGGELPVDLKDGESDGQN